MINKESCHGVCNLDIKTERVSDERFQECNQDIGNDSSSNSNSQMHSSVTSTTTTLYRPFPASNDPFISAFSPVSRFLSFPPVKQNLFQPFLPNPALTIPKPKSSLPFSVDNILRPNFGQRTRLLSSPSSSCCSSPFLTSPPPPLCSLTSSPTSTSVKDEPKSSDESSGVDLTCPRGQTSKEDDELPPGMVRGTNGQLWPAWVFCTRYSDRPSSGELTKSWFLNHFMTKQLHFLFSLYLCNK